MVTTHIPIDRISQKALAVIAITLAVATPVSTVAQQTSAASPEQSAILSSTSVHLTLPSAVEMALQRNRHLLLAHDSVRDSEEQKRIAESHFYPVLKNQSAVLHITQIEGVTIPAGALGQSSATGLLPAETLRIDQGASTSYTSGTELAQPLTQLLRIRAGVRAAEADLSSAKIQASDADNGTALQVHQLYYDVLIEQMRGTAAQDAVEAATVTEQETRRGVEEGRLLPDAELGSRTDLLDKQQAALVSRLNLDDLTLRLDDAVGLPLGTKLVLDPDALGDPPVLPTRAEAFTLARDKSPTVLAARQSVEKAKAGVSASRDAYIPDITGIARYSYQSGLPFLAHNFGTFGAAVSWDLFDGGAREANLRDARIKLSMAQTQLQQAENDVRIEISAAYDKAEQLNQLLGVTIQATEAREESLRIQTRRAEVDAQLASGVATARAALSSARMNVLNTRLNLFLAQNNIKRLLGERPE